MNTSISDATISLHRECIKCGEDKGPRQRNGGQLGLSEMGLPYKSVSAAATGSNTAWSQAGNGWPLRTWASQVVWVLGASLICHLQALWGLAHLPIGGARGCSCGPDPASALAQLGTTALSHRPAWLENSQRAQNPTFLPILLHCASLRSGTAPLRATRVHHPSLTSTTIHIYPPPTQPAGLSPQVC